jgi:hypothetical protein
MKLRDFLAQPVCQRFDTVSEWGFYMLRKKIKGRTMMLFAVHGFFAEVLLDDSGEMVAVNGYAFGEMPLEYYQMVDALNPFMKAAKPNSEILGGLEVIK